MSPARSKRQAQVVHKHERADIVKAVAVAATIVIVTAAYLIAFPNDPNFALPELSLPEGIPFERMQARRELQQMIDQQSSSYFRNSDTK